MFEVHGLYGHQRRNNFKSMVLLAGFVVLCQIILFPIWAFWVFALEPESWQQGIYAQHVWSLIKQVAFPVLLATLVWVGLGFATYKDAVRRSLVSAPLRRNGNERIYNIVENQAISLGLTTPEIEVINAPACNAFAMGLSPNQASITLTSGLLSRLTDKELAAVVAHEMSHIRNNDMRLATLSLILCSIVFALGWFMTARIRQTWHNMAKVSKPRLIVGLGLPFLMILRVGTAGAFLTMGAAGIIVGSIILLSTLGALALRFGASRAREYIADAGAIEITKDPASLISALAKIEGFAIVPKGDDLLQTVMFCGPSSGLLSSHPDIQHRVAAIIVHAADHLRGIDLKPLQRAGTILRRQTTGGEQPFSILGMNYPAWVSHPLIVLPAIIVGVATYRLLNPNIQSADFNIIGALHKTLTETSGTFSSSPNGHKGGGFSPEAFGVPTEYWPLLVNVAIGLSFMAACRILYALGIGRDVPFIKRLAGKAGDDEMEGSSNNGTTVQPLSVALRSMDFAAAVTNEAPPKTSFGRRRF